MTVNICIGCLVTSGQADFLIGKFKESAFSSPLTSDL